MENNSEDILYGSFPLLEKLQMLAEWMPLLGRLQLVAAATNPHDQALAVVAAALMGLAWAGPVVADGKDDIKYRKSVMKAVGGHWGAMKLIIGGKSGNKADLVGHAEALAGLAKAATSAFPKGSGPEAGKTAALPEIWTKPDDFKKVTLAFISEADKMVAAAKTGDMGVLGKQLGIMGKGACGACHKPFRAKKKKK